MSSPLLSAIFAKIISDCRNLLCKTGVLVVAAVVVAVALIAFISLRALSRPDAPTRKQLNLAPLIVTDPNGDTWQLDLLKGQPIDAIAAADIEPGQPLTVTTDVKIVGRTASIGLILRGRAGEQYVGGVKKNGQWQPPPAIRIIDSAERVLGADKFEYG